MIAIRMREHRETEFGLQTCLTSLGKHILSFTGFTQRR